MRDEPHEVTPFGHPRLRLSDSSPGLFAVLPRPSSAPNAKASTVSPFPLPFSLLRCHTSAQLPACSFPLGRPARVALLFLLRRAPSPRLWPSHAPNWVPLLPYSLVKVPARHATTLTLGCAPSNCKSWSPEKTVVFCGHQPSRCSARWLVSGRTHISEAA